jgi:adenylate kinase
MLRRTSPDLIAPDTTTLIGAPGSGKGTLVKNLKPAIAGERDLVPVGTGDLLRGERARNSELGNKVAPIMDAGGLVPDEYMFPIVRGRLEDFVAQRSAAIRGLLAFDGFPRNKEQADAHSKYLDEFDLRNLALHLKVPVDRFDELAARIAGRAQAELAAGREARTDDLDPEAVEERLRLAQSKLSPVVDHFGERGELVEIDALGTPQEICDKVRSLVLGLVPQVQNPQQFGGSVDHDTRSFMVRLSAQ